MQNMPGENSDRTFSVVMAHIVYPSIMFNTYLVLDTFQMIFFLHRVNGMEAGIHITKTYLI